MAVVEELIRIEDNNTLSFGDYSRKEKTKLDNVEFDGDLYKVKTFYEITKSERNGMFVYESLPGTAVHHFAANGTEVSFGVYGQGHTSITLELESDTIYQVTLDGVNAGKICTNLGGKLTLSVDLNDGKDVAVKIVKK